MSILNLVTSFGAGIFGSLIGGTTVFILTGVIALVGFAVQICTGDATFLNTLAFGVFLGPHITFAGGAAAAAYAGKKGLLNGSDTITPLYTVKSPGALIVGGLAGVCGYVIQYLLSTYIPLSFDSVALTVIIVAILARLIISRSSILSVYENNEKWYQGLSKTLVFDVIWSFGLSLAVAYGVSVTGLTSLGWGVSAVSLIFLYTKVESFPVSHHITMVAGYAAATFGNIYVAAVFGVIAMLLGEVIQRTINTNVKSHQDMPAAVIAIMSFIILAFA